MPSTVIESLKTSPNPHLYLLHVGLSKEIYNSTSRMTLNEKKQLAKKIVDNCSHRDILNIIDKLAELEFTVEFQNPIRAGNRLLAQLIAVYTASLERSSFCQFYENEVKPGKKKLSEFPISNQVKDMWEVLDRAASRTLSHDDDIKFKENGLKSMPIFYYQQLFDLPTPEEVAKGATPLILSRDPGLNEFNDKLRQNVTLPELGVDTNLQNKLSDIKNHILATPWKVGGFLLFQGGVMYGDKRVPHRVNDILNIIDKAQKNQLKVHDAYDQIIDKAKEAIDNPRVGRASSTTTFYQEIFNHHILDKEYPFKNLDTQSNKTPLLKQG